MSIGKLPMVRRGRKSYEVGRVSLCFFQKPIKKSTTKPGGTLFERKHFYESR